MQTQIAVWVKSLLWVITAMAEFPLLQFPMKYMYFMGSQWEAFLSLPLQVTFLCAAKMS